MMDVGIKAYYIKAAAIPTRLAELGFISGAEIEVINNALNNAMIIKIKGSKFIIGKGLATKIFVEELKFLQLKENTRQLP